MKIFPKLEAWAQTEERKKDLEQMQLVDLVWLEELFTIREKFLEAYDTCLEMAPAIRKDFDVDPKPDKFIDFFEEYLKKALIGHNIWYTNQIDTDKALRTYGEWRKNRHYKCVKWHDLYNDLISAKYINTSTVFNYVMIYKHLPGGEKKIQWLIAQADALFFQKSFQFSIPQFKECFRSKDDFPFKEGARAITARKGNLQQIIDRYKE